MLVQVTGASWLIGVIGDPIAQARSPGLLNAVLPESGLNALAVPLHVRASDLAQILAGMRGAQNVLGAVVTMPHKRAVVPLLDAVTDDARRADAVNVLRRESDGRLVGSMVDGEGFVRGLVSKGHDVASRSICIIGAGGVASGIAHALARHGASRLVITNRTLPRAELLARRLRDEWSRTEVVVSASMADECQIVINASSVGMGTNDLPADPRSLPAPTLVCDVVVEPEITAFMRGALERGCQVFGGREMLQAQVPLMIDFMAAGRSRT